MGTARPTSCQPRVCGGRGWAVKADGCLHLSAPCMRGWRHRHVAHAAPSRVSPAYAGVYTDLRLTLSWDRTWVEGARRHQDLARPRGVEHLSSSVSTELTLAAPPSGRPAEIVGIPRFFLGLWHRSGVNVSLVDTDAPPGRCQRLLSSVGRDLEGSDPPCDPRCQVLDRPDPGRGARPRVGAGSPPGLRRRTPPTWWGCGPG